MLWEISLRFVSKARPTFAEIVSLKAFSASILLSDIIDFTNSLFITEHLVCKNIPIRYDCKYILHNSFVDPGKAYYKKNAGTWEDIRFKDIATKGNVINMQVYRPKFVQNKTKMEDYVYYDISTYTLYFPWATDLLPHEINEIQKNLNSINSNKQKIKKLF